MTLPIHRKNSGFSLVELLIAMAAGMVVLAGLSSTFVLQNKHYSVQEHLSQAIQTNRAAIDMISREVRMAGYNPTGIDNLVGLKYDPLALVIRSDANGDGDVHDDSETIAYWFSESTNSILRFNGLWPTTFAEHVKEFRIEYLDETGNFTVTESDIRAVRLTITTQTQARDSSYPDNGGYRTLSLTTIIRPPNLGV